MSTTIHYPYHPATGERLVGSIEFIPGVYERDITRTGNTISLGDGSGTAVNWDSQITAAIQGQAALVTDSGDTCLLSEAYWSPEEEEQVDLDVPGTATRILNYNQLADTYAQLKHRIELVKEALAQSDTEAAKRLLGEAG